jgi:homoserine dehydrogenase
MRGIGVNAAVATRLLAPIDQAAALPAVALLGVGTVGSALLTRLAQLRPALKLSSVANSRRCLRASEGLPAACVREQLSFGTTQRLHEVADTLSGGGLVIDATASEEVADWHARWLAQGLCVVTANKAGCGAGLSRYRAIALHGERYGDSATVGAGLPLLRSLRELRAGGDRIRGIAGVLSGSLAWLFHRYDGMRPFSELVREARVLGYTEPDPRLDLSGQDVKRKLLILARSAGFALEENSVEVESLLPDALVQANGEQLDAALSALDAPLRERFQSAYKLGRRLRFIARLGEDGSARIGLEALAPDDPLAAGSGCDNRVALWSCRYPQQPLVIQGPGAGAEVTAAALLDDALRLAKNTL